MEGKALPEQPQATGRGAGGGPGTGMSGRP